MNLLLSSIAITHAEITQAKDGEEATKIFENAAYGVFHNFLNSTYTSNMMALADEHSAVRMVERIPSTFVPYSAFWNSLAKAYDAVSEGEVHLRESKGVMAQLGNVLYFAPGIERSAERKDVFGNPVVIQGGAFEQWLPYKRSVEKNDPMELELQRLKVYPSIPDRKLRNTQIPDELYREYAMAYGGASKAAIQKVMGTPAYVKASDVNKLKMLDRAIQHARAPLRNKLLRDMKRSGILPTRVG